ncbi:MAG TPA: EMC3/TMCO1 family protein [Candidatus Nanoarchaeia archaeon]|nr:EMC3/TMCO1 family protein [Candidatus Nanoarchaeia archaeon]
MSFLDPLLNPVLLPLLKLGPFWAVLILSIIITLITTLVYKYATNQQEMKRLKDEQKEYQNKIKELRGNPQEMMKVQKEAMSKNMEYMKHSFKATLITMLPIIIIFSWMSAHLMYEPIFPGDRFSLKAEFAEGVSGEAELMVSEQLQLLTPSRQPINSGLIWNLKGVKEGDGFVTVKHGADQQTKKVLVTKELSYEQPITLYDNSDIKKIEISYNQLRPLGQEFSIFGWKPGWLGLYIIFSIVLSLALRKILKIY